MDEREELRYLVTLVTEASKWTLSEDDTRDTIRLEVEHRISVLMGDGSNELDEQGRVHDTPRGTVRSRQYRNGKVRVTGSDGKKHWYPAELCVRVKCKHSKTGYSWKLREVDDGETKS